MCSELQWLISKSAPMVDSENQPIPASGYFSGRLPARMVGAFKGWLNTSAGAVYRSGSSTGCYTWVVGNVHFMAKFGVYFSTQDSITFTYEYQPE